jgi:hypothetical protein
MMLLLSVPARPRAARKEVDEYDRISVKKAGKIIKFEDAKRARQPAPGPLRGPVELKVPERASGVDKVVAIQEDAEAERRQKADKIEEFIWRFENSAACLMACAKERLELTSKDDWDDMLAFKRSHCDSRGKELNRALSSAWSMVDVTVSTVTFAMKRLDFNHPVLPDLLSTAEAAAAHMKWKDNEPDGLAMTAGDIVLAAKELKKLVSKHRNPRRRKR